jgi:hypothetical protein
MSKDNDGRARAAHEFNKIIQEGTVCHLSLHDGRSALTLSIRTQKGEERKASRQDIWPEAARRKALPGRVTVAGKQSWCPEGRLAIRCLHPTDMFKRAQRPTSLRPITNGTAAVTRSVSRFHQLNGGHDARGSGGAGFNVRGMGMTVVVAQNFVPGTTAADIRAVFAPDKSQGLNSCRIVTASPTVIAELVFNSQDEAEGVVAKFNNKMVCTSTVLVSADNLSGRWQTSLCLPSTEPSNRTPPD